MSDFKLRPHHALCIQFFKGYGYSEEFTQNMGSTIEGLKSNPTVKIVKGADMLCAKCPNLSGEDCVNCEQNVTALDERTAQLCGYEYGSEVSAKSFFTAAKQNIILVGKLAEICGDCKWKELCQVENHN